MAPILRILAALVAVFTLTNATPLHNLRQTQPDVCIDGATIPNLWSVRDLLVIYSTDDGQTPSNATFTITNMRTNLTETLHCDLRANYQCAFTGTPNDKATSIWFQLNLRAYFSFSQTQSCDGATAQVQGTAEMELHCKGDSLEEGMSCTGDAEPSLASGLVAVSKPGS